MRLLPVLSRVAKHSGLTSLGTTRIQVRNNSHYLRDSLDRSIETVKLQFDKYSPESSASEDKSPVIMLHGLFGSKTNNRTVAKELATRLNRDIYCLDLRNFGLSPHTERLDYPALASDVERFIDESKFKEKAILVGHSMGAKTAMAVSLRRPDIPKMIVSVDNVPLSFSASSNSDHLKYINSLRISLEKHKYTNIKDVDSELEKVEKSKPIRQFLLTNINRGKKGEPLTSKIPLEIIYKALVRGEVAAWPFDSNITRFSSGPALFIRGTQSSYVPDDAIPEIGKFFPDFEVLDIDAGHWLISEKPKEFIQGLVEFIERKED